MITEYIMTEDSTDICIKIIRSGRKSIGLEVKADRKSVV